MNVKNTFVIILLFLILFSTVTFVSADDDRSYSIDQVITDLTVKNNGLLHVEEQYDYSFDGAFNGVYRDIPLKSGESIENIKIHVDGAYATYEESDDDGYKHVKIYLYSDAAHTKGIKDCNVKVYISYDLIGAVTIFNDVSGLQYKLWGEEWDVGANNLKATVHLPGNNGNEYYLTPSEYNDTSSLKGNTITAESSYIPKGEYYELLVLMPVDDFNKSPNAKHVNQNGHDMIMKNLKNTINERDFWNTTYLVLGLLTLISPISAIIVYLKYGREPEVNYDGIYERDLPTNDPPEIVNALIENKMSIGHPNIKGFEASIMNLIDRKFITLSSQENIESNTKDLMLTLNNKARLSASEQIVFDTLNHFSTNNILNLSTLNGQLSSETNGKWFMEKIREWESSVENDMDVSRFFDDRGSSIMNVIGLLGIPFAIALIVLGFITNLNNGLYSIAGGIFLIIFSIVITMSDDDIFGRWTEEGRVYYLKWKNLKNFLEDNSLIKEHPPESIIIWKKYLIYGAALGVADKVYESMKLQVPNISDYDNDGLFMYHYYGGYGMMNMAFSTGEISANPSDSSGFGGSGGGSGGGGGGAF
ncbi:DUF2207 domain-containing protein [Methanobrevibacter gottschalkii]|uniref:DUF2207 domain-containing protein n=1 Tax=Methanobrevibacter gottschalkii TaxID=190974 RepID=UPI0038D06038